MIAYKEYRESELKKKINAEHSPNSINLKDKLWSMREVYQRKSRVIHKRGLMHTVGIAFSRWSEEGGYLDELRGARLSIR